MKKQLVAVVLAAGSGSRFWPFTTNKILLPFFGKPFFDYSVRDVLPSEVTRVVIIASEPISDYFKRATFSVPHDIVIQKDARGMADAILSAQTRISGASLLILNADDIFDRTLLSGVLATAQKSQASGVIPGWQPQQYFPGGYLKLKGDQVTDIIEKPGPGNEPSLYAATLGHYIDDGDSLLDALKVTTSEHDDVYEKALTSLMKTSRFVMHPYDGPFASLKYPWHVLDCMQILFGKLKSHRGQNVQIKNNVIIEGDVWIGDNVKIFENTKITGPCYIGPNSIIGSNSLIRQSHLGAGCITGFSTDITRSYMGDNCWFHTNYVGDSVLEGNVSMGSGAVLANLRLDEGEIYTVVKGNKVSTGRLKLGAIIGRDVRIGVNASIMPGVKIGKNSLVGSGITVDKDLVQDSFVTGMTASYVVRKNTRIIDKSAREHFKKSL